MGNKQKLSQESYNNMGGKNHKYVKIPESNNDYNHSEKLLYYYFYILPQCVLRIRDVINPTILFRN